MAEINNSLALGIKPPEFDIAKPLLQAGQINSLRANTAKTQQDIDYNQFLQDQGGGFRPGEANTLAATSQKRLEIGSQIGNMMVGAKTTADRQQAIQAAKDSGEKIDPRVEKHLLEAPLSQFQQYGRNLQGGGQSSTSNIEQNPALIAQRSQAGTGGALAGSIYGPPGYKSPTPAGGRGGNGPQNEPGPDVSLLEKKGAAEVSSQLSGEQLKKYATASEAAANQKVALRDLMLKAEDVRTGKYAGREQEARKILQAASEYFPSLKQYSPDKAIAAFESINKDQGIVAREAQKSVGGTAASELSAITDSLVGGGTSHGGIINNGSQLLGLKNAEMAKNIAAQAYFQKYQTTKGFDADFTKNAGPAAWVYMALPPEEQDSIRDKLNKTKAGQATFNSIVRQMHYIHKNKYDEGLE